MLLANQLVGFGAGGSSNPRILPLLQSLGQDTDLEILLDAADADSYPGSGQTWSDLSGNGSDFHLGTGTGASTDDPTFNGTAGGFSSNEYFSFDGGDFFEINGGNTAFLETLHKNNAVFTVLAFIYLAANNCAIAGNSSSGPQRGARLLVTGTSTLRQTCNNGSTSSLSELSTATLSTGAWQCAGLSYNEATPLGTFYVDGSTDTHTSSYSSPSASAATHDWKVAAAGNVANQFTSGSRMAVYMMWSRALSASEMADIHTAIDSLRGY